MGTSSPFPGIKNGKPIIPSWAGNGGNGNPTDTPNPPENPDTPPPEQQPQQPDPNQDVQPLVDLRSARINFGKYASNNRDSQYLRKGVSSYVQRGLGGARNATVRMGTTRRAATTLFGVVQDFVRLGRNEAIERFQLTHLRDNGLQNVFTTLVDFICTPGSGLDESVTRQAYLKTVEQFPTLGINDQGEMTADMAQAIMLAFITESIFSRLIVDVGDNIRKYAAVGDIARVEQDIHDFIQGCICQRLQESLGRMNALNQDEVERHIQEVYEIAFDILAGEGDE
jgi:hypothetical protein